MLHVDKRNLHTLNAGTDAFKCIAQGESTDVWHENRAKFQEDYWDSNNASAREKKIVSFIKENHHGTQIHSTQYIWCFRKDNISDLWY